MRRLVCTRASSACSASGSCARGSPNATEPPTVPRERVPGWPTWRTAWASRGQWRATIRERSSAAWRVVAPMCSTPCERRMIPSPGMRLMSTSRAGRSSRRFISGTRLCPPASTVAPPASSSTRVFDAAGDDVLERRGLHRRLRISSAATRAAAPAATAGGDDSSGAGGRGLSPLAPSTGLDAAGATGDCPGWRAADRARRRAAPSATPRPRGTSPSPRPRRSPPGRVTAAPPTPARP